MVIDVIPFLILSAVAIAAALAMLTSRDAIHAALFLVINLGTLAVFYLLLNAPFLAMAQVAVYAGAIMVLFLFVIMLLGAERLEHEGRLAWQRPLAILLAVVLLIEGGYLLLERVGERAAMTETLSDSSPQAVAELLFDSYMLPFEVTSVLLLASMVGAVILTASQKEQDE